MTIATPSRFDPARYDCVFFDFDGVIVDSVETKVRAFGELYAGFGEGAREVAMAYQRATPGETRFEKIPKLHAMLGQPFGEGELAVWCDRLAAIVVDQVVASPLLPDVMDVLVWLAAQGIPAHVVSGTPQDELRLIAERKGIAHWFRSLRGAPQGKAAIVRDILAAERLAPERCLFIGDAMTDFACAEATGTTFLGAVEQDSPFPADTRIVRHLGEVFIDAVRRDRLRAA